ADAPRAAQPVRPARAVRPRLPAALPVVATAVAAARGVPPHDPPGSQAHPPRAVGRLHPSPERPAVPGARRAQVPPENALLRPARIDARDPRVPRAGVRRSVPNLTDPIHAGV